MDKYIPAGIATSRMWLRRSATRRRLQDLDKRRLDDVGLTETERRRECAKWFWQA